VTKTSTTKKKKREGSKNACQEYREYDRMGKWVDWFKGEIK
jgi:hypothetical protein